MSSIVQKLAKRGAKLHFCYEAGPTGYEFYRQLTEMGHDRVVAAPALIPKRPGDRVKTNRRDAISLARLHRAGELTAVWVPDRGMRLTAISCGPEKQPRRLKSGATAASVVPPSTWPSLRAAHPGRWHIAVAIDSEFEHPAHSIVSRNLPGIEDAEVRLKRLIDLISETVKSWTMALSSKPIRRYEACR